MTENKICPFFGFCGGCQYQNLSEEAYVDKKNLFSRRAFADYGLDVDLNSIQSVPLGTRRRASFAYMGSHLGYNARKSHQIVEITECRLLKPEIVSFLPTLRQWTEKLGGRGDVFVLATPYGLDIHIRPDRPEKPTLERLELLTGFAGDSAVARLIYQGTPVAEKVRLPILPDDFLQPSPEGEKVLIDLMLDHIGSARHAVDLFCGNGTFTRPLIERGIRVKGYDTSESVQNLGTFGLKRDLFRSPLLPEEMTDLDLIVLDPPRAGAKAQIEQIAQTQVPKIIMISCAPKTAARDCRILTDAGWKIQSITPVDQFRWSDHIEIVCILDKTIEPL